MNAKIVNMAKQIQDKNKPKSSTWRTPVVAVMGHVDHGKTSLLDAIRGTNVQAREKGGITQNTRAHQIVSPAGNKITFIDTPGHEAFSAMRSRGAQVTDFVLLVVAADDGIQPQTKQSIQFAQQAGVPVIVAINKIDISGVKLDKVKQQLASFGVHIEEYGGDALCFPVSATTKQGITELIEGIELLAEVKELQPHQPEFEANAEAFVLESSADKKIGSVALCIAKAGHIGERLSVATSSTPVFKVRNYLDHEQKPVTEVNEGDPFWITGLPQPLTTGEKIYFADEDKKAEAIKTQIAKQEEEVADAAAALSAEQKFLQLIVAQQAAAQGLDKKVLNILVKASSMGTLEAVKAELGKLKDENTEINILDAGTGEITESDVRRAKLANGLVVSFQLPIGNAIEKLAKQEKVLIKNYEVIYEMIDELGAALQSLIEPEEEEVEVARAKVKQVFTLTNGSIVAGCEVIKGTILKGYRVYVERPSASTSDEIAEVARGKITELRIQKTETREVKKGQECGIMLDPEPVGIQEGDEIVAYKVE